MPLQLIAHALVLGILGHLCAGGRNGLLLGYISTLYRVVGAKLSLPSPLSRTFSIHHPVRTCSTVWGKNLGSEKHVHHTQSWQLTTVEEKNKSGCARTLVFNTLKDQFLAVPHLHEKQVADKVLKGHNSFLLGFMALGV